MFNLLGGSEQISKEFPSSSSPSLRIMDFSRPEVEKNEQKILLQRKTLTSPVQNKGVSTLTGAVVVDEQSSTLLSLDGEEEQKEKILIMDDYREKDVPLSLHEQRIRRAYVQQEKKDMNLDRKKEEQVFHLKNTIEQNMQVVGEDLLSLPKFTKETVKDSIASEKDVRRKRMKAFFYKGWQLLVNNKEKTPAVMARLGMAYEETMCNLHPTVPAPIMKLVVKRLWPQGNETSPVKNLYVALVKKFPVAQEEKVISKHSTQEIKRNDDTRVQTHTPLQKLPASYFTKDQKATIIDLPSYATEKRPSTSVISTVKFTEKTVHSSSAPIDFTTKLKERAKGLFGKVTSLFKKAA